MGSPQRDWTDPALARITFSEYALARLRSRTDLKPKTRYQYQSLLSLHILPTWRTVPLAKITFEGLTQWVARLAQDGLGPSAVRQSVFVMSAALDHAVRSGRIRANPARGLGLPWTQRRDHIFLTHEQLHALAAEAGPVASIRPAARLHGPALGRSHGPSCLRHRLGPAQD